MLWSGGPFYLGDAAATPQVIVVRDEGSSADLDDYSRAAGEAAAQYQKVANARRRVEVSKAKITNIKSLLAKVPKGLDILRLPLEADMRKAQAELKAAEEELKNQIAFEETSRKAQAQAISGFEKVNLLIGVGVVLGISLVGLTLASTIRAVRA